jgi:hypothetical protein
LSERPGLFVIINKSIRGGTNMPNGNVRGFENMKISISISKPEVAMRSAIATSCGLLAYSKIINNLRKVDVSSPEGESYRLNFTSYYKVRRDEGWLAEFYSFLEANKENGSLTYGDVIRFISDVPHKTKNGPAKTVEASFASKLFSTINPENPIWDGQVIKALGIDVKTEGSNETRIEECIEIYAELKRAVGAYISSDEGRECIRVFDGVFPDYVWVSPYKKIDFFLWNLGK